MKQLIIIIGFLSFYAGVLKSQEAYPITFTQGPELLAFAGNDTIVCPLYPVTLGADPTATGGNGTYFYTWSPPTFLDDPTSANPVVTPEESTTYMLSVSDGNGCSVIRFVNIIVDPCLGIDNQPLSESLVVYPNPASERLFISGIDLAITRQVSYQIVNSIGQVLRTTNYDLNEQSQNIEIDLGGLPTGLYYMKILVDNELIIRSIQIQ